jgi:hypothetical protein
MDAEPFSDNWTYLRTELSWLDRLLATAVARQRKDVKEINRVARSRADQVSSHWWKGLVVIDADIGGDSPAETPKSKATGAKNQQQIEARIRSSQQQGILLGLPNLCQQLQLTPFEKNVVLMALAPEMSQRYGRIYSFLQEVDSSQGSSLPTVDLILRLLCRTDAEWRKARLLLTEQSTLIHHQVIQLPFSGTESFLANPIKLPNPLVEYLLSDRPDAIALQHILQNMTLNLEGLGSPVVYLDSPPEKVDGVITEERLFLQEMLILPQGASDDLLEGEQLAERTDLWQSMVLPEPLLAALRRLCDRVQFAEAVDHIWGCQHSSKSEPFASTISLLVGASGTGKTLAGFAISHALDAPFYCIDLAVVHPSDYPVVLREISAQAPAVLMIKSADCWLGRTSTVSTEQIHQFLAIRRQRRGLTLLSVERKERIAPTWQRQIDQILEFPFPNQASRLRLWQQVFPAQIKLELDLDWRSLAKLKLSGGQIQAIARTATVYAFAEGVDTKESEDIAVGMRHLRNAIADFTNYR